MMTEPDLMRRTLGGLSEKISRRHRERLAIVYIRQSTVQQVERHQESTRLQYALVDRAFHLGWGGRASWWSMTILVARGNDRRPARLSAPGGRSRPRPCWARARRGDVAPGPIGPGLASASGDLRAVRHAYCRRRWRL